MWQGGILYCCNLPSLSFSLLPLNLGSEVFRRTLLVVSVLFWGCTIMDLVLPILCCSFRIWSQRSFSVSDIFRFGQTTATIWSAHGSFAFTKAHSPFLLLPFILTLLSSPGIGFTVDKQLLIVFLIPAGLSLTSHTVTAANLWDEKNTIRSCRLT